MIHEQWKHMFAIHIQVPRITSRASLQNGDASYAQRSTGFLGRFDLRYMMPLFILHATSKDMSPCISTLFSQESMLANSAQSIYAHFFASNYDANVVDRQSQVAYAQRLNMPLPLCDSYSTWSLNASCVIGAVQNVLETSCGHAYSNAVQLSSQW